MPPAQFISSCIFKKYPDRYASEDLVEGKLGATEFKFSEVHAEEKYEIRDSDGKNRTEFSTLFKGLFFVADFNKLKFPIFEICQLGETIPPKNKR